MAASYVGHNYTENSNATATLDNTKSVTAGNGVLLVGLFDGGVVTCVFASDKGDTVVQPATGGIVGVRLFVGYVKSAVGGSTVWTMTGASNDYKGFDVIEVAGTDTTAPEDGKDNDSGSGLTSLSAGAITPAEAGIRIAAIQRNAGGTFDPPGGSWVSVMEQETYTNVSGATAYLIGASGSTDLTWGFAVGNAEAAIIAFKESAGGGGGGAAPTYCIPKSFNTARRIA